MDRLGLVRLQWTTHDHSWNFIGSYWNKRGIVHTRGSPVLMTNCVCTCPEYYHTTRSGGLERLGPISLRGLQLGIFSIKQVVEFFDNQEHIYILQNNPPFSIVYKTSMSCYTSVDFELLLQKVAFNLFVWLLKSK